MPADGRTGLLNIVFKWPALPRGTFPGQNVKGYGRTKWIVTKVCEACIIHHKKLLTFRTTFNVTIWLRRSVGVGLVQHIK